MSKSATDQGLAELQFAEEFAETSMHGLPPLAGRMVGLLLVTDQPNLSSRDLMKRLGASSASISNMGRLLLRLGLVERTVSPETRRDLFSLRIDAWQHPFRNAREFAEKALELVDKTLEQGLDPSSDLAEAKLRDMRDYYAFQCRELPLLDERFEEWRRQKYAGRQEAE